MLRTGAGNAITQKKFHKHQKLVKKQSAHIREGRENVALACPAMNSFMLIHRAETVILFWVRVPVLSEQMVVTLPMVSHADSTRTKFWSSY